MPTLLVTFFKVRIFSNEKYFSSWKDITVPFYISICELFRHLCRGQPWDWQMSYAVFNLCCFRAFRVYFFVRNFFQLSFICISYCFSQSSPFISTVGFRTSSNLLLIIKSDGGISFFSYIFINSFRELVSRGLSYSFRCYRLANKNNTWINFKRIGSK